MSFETWAAAKYNRQWILAVELTIALVSTGATTTLYLATKSGQWDGSHNFRMCLDAPIDLTILGQQFSGTSGVTNYGTLTLWRSDTRKLLLDPEIYSDDLIEIYTMEGYPVIMRLGGKDLAYSDWKVVRQGTAQTPKFYSDRFEIPVSGSETEHLNAMMPDNVYTSGGSMPSETVGKPKPICLGECRNVTPFLIDSSTSTYQFNDPAYGPVNAVNEVRINGKVTTGLTTNLTQGTIVSPSGRPTLSVSGRISDVLGGYYPTLGKVIQDVLRKFGGAAAADLDTTAFSNYETAWSPDVGLYLTRKITIKQVLDILIRGQLSFLIYNWTGKWFPYRVQNVTGTPDKTVRERDIVSRSFKRTRDDSSPMWKCSINYKRNWTVNNNPDSTVNATDVEWLGNQYLTSEYSDSGVLTLYPKAIEVGPHDTVLVDSADADQLAEDWVTLMSVPRGYYEYDARMANLDDDFGDLYNVIRSRDGMSGGKLMRVFGHKGDLSQRLLHPIAWG
jgi:hypothetical protein